MRLSGPIETEINPSMSVAQARRMFNRVLCAWTSDVLWLRKHGLDRPSLRVGRGHGVCEEPEQGASSRTPRRRAA